MCTRRTAGARYIPDFARSWSDRRLSSSATAYCSALCPSMPRAPSLRVRRYASRNHSTSMWCASVVSGTFGAAFASFAIRSSLVEMAFEPCVSFIVPSFGSTSQAPPFARQGPLGRFPHVFARTAALRLPVLPTALTRACSVVPSRNGESGTSQVPRSPSPCMPRPSIPAEPRSQTPGRLPLRCFARWCLPCSPACRPPRLLDFGTASAACTLAVYAS